jgi:hypothetical protein
LEVAFRYSVASCEVSTAKLPDAMTGKWLMVVELMSKLEESQSPP